MSKQYDAYTFDSGGGFQSQSVCPDYLNCPICQSAGKCMKYNSQSKPFGGVEVPRARYCPMTHLHCHDPLCEENICLRQREKDLADTGNLQYATPIHIKPDGTEHEYWHVINRQLDIIDRLTKGEEHYPKPAKALTSLYSIVTPSGDISVIKSNLNNMPQTIVVPFGQNNVPGQLVPVAADNVTVEPISTINAGSEGYTTSDTTIATAAAVPGGPEGAFVVSRVPNAVGTVTVLYTAVNTAGTTITNVGGVGDTFTFQGQPTGVASALTATFGAPTA